MQNRQQITNQAIRLGYNSEGEGISRAQNTPLAFLADYILVQNMNQTAFIKYEADEVKRFDDNRTGFRKYKVRVAGTRRTLRGITAGVDVFFENVMTHVTATEQLNHGDQVVMIVWSRTSRGSTGRLEGSKGVSTGMINVEDFEPDKLLQHVRDAQTSDTTFDLIRSVIIVKYVRAPRGGRWLLYDEQMNQFLKRKRCVVQVRSSEFNDCFWRCIQLGLHEDNAAMYRKLYRSYRQMNISNPRLQELKELALQSGIRFGECIALTDIPKVETALQCTILVVNLRTLKFIYKGTSGVNRLLITLGFLDHHQEGHYFYIKRNKLGRLFDRHHFCFTCMKPYFNKGSHRCPGTAYCKACKREECLGREYTTRHDFTEYCDRCNMHYYDQECLEVHKCSHCRCTICQMVYKLPKDLNAPDNHQCYTYRCTNCHKSASLESEHRCMMQSTKPLDGKLPKRKNKGLIFYDFECYLGGDVHEPALIVAAYGDDTSYETTEFRYFYDIGMFMNWVLQPAHKDFVVMAHNSGRYDIHFIKQWGIQTHQVMDDLVKGNKFIKTTFTEYKVTFMDTLQFLPFSLRRFSKAFRIEEQTKGYFPYRFFTKSNEYYIGPMPDLEWFDFDRLDESERAKALEWYEEHQHDRIDLRDMCLEYCKSDVYLLMIGAVKFQKEIIELTGLDPYESSTIASSAMRIYKFHDMPKHSIGLFASRNESVYEERLLYQQYALQCNAVIPNDLSYPECVVAIQHNPPHPITAYVYFGCVDHGCPRCTQAYQIHPFKFAQMNSLYSYTKVTIQRLKDQGLNLKVMWGCQFEQKRQTDLTFKMLQLPDELVPLKIHDAFFGGRTEPFCLYYRAKDNERIEYVDFTSLYPSIQSGKNRSVTDVNQVVTYPYPIGHPVYLKTVTPDTLFQYFGFAKVLIHPPEGLHLPLLPARGEGKLLFDLKTKVGTWTILELQKAVELGYVIQHVYEVVHFEEQTTELFSSYVKRFFRCKTEAGGLQKLGVTENDIEWLNAYKEYHGFELDVSKMNDMNAPQYLVSKLYCNSLWGKFAQKDDNNNTKDVFSYDELNKLVFDPTVLVMDIFFHDQDARTVIWKRRKEYKTPARNTNLAVAAFTTAHARLRLYEALEAYNDRVLYCDTDSVIAVQPMDQPRPVRLGSYLGDLVSELDDDEWIVEFVATAPKSYAYRTNKGQEVVHVKGFTLNYETSQLIDFDTMRQLVNADDPEKVIETKQLRFIIDEHHQIRTDPDAVKQFKYTFTKRRRLNDDVDGAIRTTPIE